MNATPLSRDNDSTVNCFAVHRTSSHIAIRCTRQFAAILRLKTEGRAPGFAGTVLMETGNSWYQLCSRDTLDHKEGDVDEATAQLFLEFAFIELNELLATIDEDVVVGLPPVVSTPLREVRGIRVNGNLSSRPVKPRFTGKKFHQLKEHFSRAH